MSITALTTVTAAASAPITVPEAKQHLRITHSAEDKYIETLVHAATAWAETHTNRFFVSRTMSLAFDRFPSSGYYVYTFGTYSLQSRIVDNSVRDMAICLPGGLVTAVNDIDYTDSDGNPQTLTGLTSSPAGTGYQEDLTDDERALLFPVAGTDWPDVVDNTPNAVAVEYVVGYGANGDSVPFDIRHAIKLRVADLFSGRGTGEGKGPSEALRAATDLLWPYVIQRI